MRDAAAIVGIAESEYTRWGRLERLVSNLIGGAPGEMCVGLAVEVPFEEVAAKVVVPRFRVRRE